MVFSNYLEIAANVGGEAFFQNSDYFRELGRRRKGLEIRAAIKACHASCSPKFPSSLSNRPNETHPELGATIIEINELGKGRPFSRKRAAVAEIIELFGIASGWNFAGREWAS